MKKLPTQHNLKLFLRIIFLFFLFIGMSNTYGDNLATATGIGSTTTTTTDIYVDVVSATVSVGAGVTEVMVVATFEVFASVKTKHKAYFKLKDNTNSTYSQVIIRHLERATDGDKGIGSLVYIFTVPENSGSAEFILQHATSDDSYNNTTSGTIVAIALGTTASHIPLGNDVKSITTGVPVAADDEWTEVTGLTTTTISLPADGDMFIATSINSELKGGNNQTGEWKLQQKKESGAWEDVGLSTSRSLNAPYDQGIASLGMMITGLTKGDYSFQLLHKGTGTNVETLNTSIIAVALAYLDNNDIGRAFPAFKTSSTSETTTSTTLTPAVSQAGTPANNTDMFIYAQYKMSATAAFDSPTFDIYVVDDNDPPFTYSSQEQRRRLNDDTDIGSGASVGLVQSLTVASTYTASLRHASNGTITLTTSSIILSGFQTTDYICAGYWVGGTINHLNEWNNTANWADGVVPTSSTNVSLYDKDNNPVINSSANCNSLFIESGASLSILENKDLTVASDLDNSGTLTIESSVAGTGSLIVEGTSTGNVNVERYIAAWSGSTDGWHLLASPIETFTINESAFDPGDNDDFYRWEESTNLWMNHKAGDPTEINPGIGYLTAWQSSVTKTFTGALNNENIVNTNLSFTGSQTYTGYHLLGNPYPSALQWNVTDWSGNNVNANVKIWHEGNASYSDIGEDGTIPAMQGFMVYVSSSPNSLTIPIAKRIHSTTAWYKDTELNRIKLTVFDTEGGTAQESIIKFNEDATSGFDNDFDSRFMAGYAPHIYSETEDGALSTNVLSEITIEVTIPMSFIKNASSTYYIEVEGVNNLEPQETVYLTDLKTNHTQILNDNPVYNFTSEEGDIIERFVIHFSPLGIEEPESTELIQIWAASNSINILNQTNSVGEIRLINMFGQEVFKSKLNGDSNQQISVNVASGYYIVNTVTNNGVVNTKIYLR